MNSHDIQKTVAAWQAHIGRKGGLKGGVSRSDAKRASSRANAAKARAAKAEKRLKGEGK